MQEFEQKKRWEVRNILSKEKCESLIQEIKAAPFETLEFKMTFNINEDLSKFIWDKIKNNKELNELSNDWKPYGVHDYMKFYYYDDPKHHFPEHWDSPCLIEPNKKEGLVTLTIYLNDDFEGGQTCFADGNVTPEQGKGSFFTKPNNLHKALPVISGAKYILRCDVLFEKI